MKLIRIKDAAKILGISEVGVRSMIRRGKLPYYRPTGKLLMFDVEEIEKYVRRSRNMPLEKGATK
ncbi:MAG: helix-turn-helix domain-containing protein [Bacteroides sp.]|jgi:excisionase family DNA binding protein|nr:helix-turn-helix domain-containing protein [Bacteroides sp.]